jgi:hypothetical protein
VTAMAVLRRLYESSRLYANFFQPCCKLKSKHREAARIYKAYERPETPCQRLLASNDVTPEAKERLQRTLEGLDPVLLLKQIREARDTLRALIENKKPEVVAPGVKTFVNSLATPWRAGEVRPTHRRETQALVAYSQRPLCRSLAGFAELAAGEAGHGIQGDAEEIAC